MAHVGILRKLEELRVPVDCIAGTSIGALVGGLYASGMSVDELDALVQSLDWKELFNDSLERRERSYRRKQDDRDSLATVGVGLRDGQLRMSGGVLEGQRILAMFERLTLSVSSIDDFDKLPIPYRATATDLNTGDAVVLDHGSLAMAMRASMSLPGIFHPAVIEDRVLLDGGLVNQVPIDVVRAMGADIVIAVDVGTPLSHFDRDVGVLDVLSQLTTMMTTKNAQVQRDTLGPRDVLIVPELGEVVSTGDFEKAAEALEIGNAAAEEAVPRLAAMGLPVEQYATLHRQRAVRKDAPPTVDFIRLDNQTSYADQFLLKYFDQRVGGPIDTARMEEATIRAYSLGTLSSITYELVGEGDRTGILIRAHEKPQGPNYLQLGFRADSDREGTFESSLRMAMLFSPLSEYGAEGRVGIDIGSEPGVRAEYFYSFDVRNRYLMHASAGYENRNIHVYDNDGRNISTYDVRTLGAGLWFGREFGNYGAFGLGIESASGRAKQEVGDVRLDRFDIDHGAWYVDARLDRLDSLYFPRTGYYASLEYRRSSGLLGADNDYEQAGIDFLIAKDAGRHAFQFASAWHSTISGIAPLQERFRLGGRGRLAGFRYNELTGQHYELVAAGYSYQLADVFGRSALVGGTLEYGNAWERKRDMDFGDGLFNASIYVGYDSALGPLLIGYGWREDGGGVVFLDIGQPF